MKQTDLDPRLQLAPPGERAGLVLFLLVGALPVALVAVSVGLQVMDGAGGTGTLLLAVAITAPAFLALWWVLRVFMHRRALRASIDALDVRSSFYHCHVDLSALDLEQARVVNLDEHPELRPLLKTNGFSLPGFRSGWFRLRNRRRCFVAMAAGPRVLWLPTDAHDLLLETRDPSALLSRLRQLATPGARA